MILRFAFPSQPVIVSDDFDCRYGTRKEEGGQMGLNQGKVANILYDE